MNGNNRKKSTGWYAPMAQNEENMSLQAEPEKKRRGLPLGLQILFGTLLVLALIVGSSAFFAGKAAETVIRESEAESSNPGRDSGFNIILPEDIPGLFDNDGSSDKEDMPEDWKDFFNSFYVTEGGKAYYNIPRVEERPEWEMKLAAPEKEEKTLQQIYQECVDAVVSIRSYEDKETGYYWGTGIVLSEDGLILTNAHVIEDCDSATVALQDETEYEAKLVGTDSTSDIAVLKIEAKGLTPAVFGDSEEITVGDSVAAIGNPLGEEFRATLTDGIISAIDRGVSYDGHSMNLIQTNTAINEGNSGGALVNMYGQVIGMTNMKMMSNYSSIEGIGFAIPSATVKNVVNALIRDGEVRGRPALGITVGAVPDTAAEHYDLPVGLYISMVSEGSDAEKKGLREGDIITAVNGEPAKSSQTIVDIRDTLEIGDSMTFTIWREGETFDVDIELIEYNNVY